MGRSCDGRETSRLEPCNHGSAVRLQRWQFAGRRSNAMPACARATMITYTIDHYSMRSTMAFAASRPTSIWSRTSCWWHTHGMELSPDRTLRSLYLDPLRRRVKNNGGSVHGDGQAGDAVDRHQVGWRDHLPCARMICWPSTATFFHRLKMVKCMSGGDRHRQRQSSHAFNRG